MEKLTAIDTPYFTHTITNEDRSSVVDKNTAKHRADKLKVHLIINLHDGSTSTERLVNCTKDHETVYAIGSIVEPDSFDPDLESVCSNGIHYFRSIECAYFYDFDPIYNKYTGIFKAWYDNGMLMIKCTILDGKFNGLYEYWMASILGHEKYIAHRTHTHTRCHFLNDKRNGLCENWYDNGTLSQKCNYVDDRYDGLYESWYCDGSLEMRGNYVDEKLDGLCEYYNMDGTLTLNNYVNGYSRSQNSFTSLQ